jgi:hypothetical protein
VCTCCHSVFGCYYLAYPYVSCVCLLAVFLDGVSVRSVVKCFACMSCESCASMCITMSLQLCLCLCLTPCLSLFLVYIVTHAPPVYLYRFVWEGFMDALSVGAPFGPSWQLKCGGAMHIHFS